DSYEGSFDLQNPITDYVVNYQTGVLTFRKDIAPNYVIAVRFKDRAGAWYPESNYLMIKADYADFPSLTGENRRKRYEIYELKGCYLLGHANIDLADPNFLIEIRNLNKENRYKGRSFLWIFGLDRNNDGRIDPAYIDPELGLISFPANTPFDLRLGDYPPDGEFVDNEEDSSYRSEINSEYTPDQQKTLSNTTLYTTSPQIKYHIHIEYKSQVKEYFLRPFIVEGSEGIYVNGVKMAKDVDYLIDYESGWITFIGQVKIDEETKIEATYEYMPFGGQFQKSLLGMRGEYKPGDNFHLGSTYIYEGTSTPLTVPKIGQIPDCLQVLDVDTKIRLLPIIENLFDFDIPLEIDLSAEAAKSWKNPNLFGYAMVESMQGVETEYSVSMDAQAWALGSLGGAPRGILRYRDEPYRERAGPYNEEVGHLVKREVKGKQKSLVLKYELNPPESIAVVSPLSRVSLDFSKYDSLEVWTKGVTSETIHIDLGIFSEDADGDGVLDTEDKNRDGLLNPGEDVGWEFNGSGGAIITRVGVGNSRLDSEDLDGDGRLNSSLPGFEESYFNLELKDKYRIKEYSKDIESGWTLYSIPLKEAAPAGSFDSKSWNLIKHIRIRVKASGRGEIYIDEIAAIGTRWEKGVVLVDGREKTPLGESYFTITAKNSKDDPDYKDLKDDPEFKKLYRGEDLAKYKEEALVLRYNLAPNEVGKTAYTYTYARDYSQHKKLRFWIYGFGKGENLFFRFGTDNANYFGEKIKVNFSGWRLFEIDLRRSREAWLAGGEYQGKPLMSNIKTLQLGVYGDASGEIWINEVHLAETEIDEGHARRIKVETSWADWLKLRWGEKVMESAFSSMGMTAPTQDITTQDWSFELSKIKWLPLSYSGSRSRIETDPEKVENVITRDLGTKCEEKYTYGIKFLRDKLPKITCSYMTREADIAYQEERRLEDEGTFTGEISYAYGFSEKVLGIPIGKRLELSPGYKYIGASKKTTYPNDRSKDRLLLEKTHDGVIGLRFSPKTSLSTSSSIGFRERLKWEELSNWRDQDYKLQSRNLKVNFGADYSAIKGVRPKLDTGADFDETYTHSYSPAQEDKKSVSSEADFKFLTKFTPKEWMESLKFIDLEHTFRLNVKASYTDLDGKEGTSETLGKVYHDYSQLIRGISLEGDPAGIATKRRSASNIRTNSLGTNWYLWDPLDLSTRYSLENQESSSQSSIIYRDTASYNLSLRLSLNEAFGFWKRITLSSYLLTKYTQSEKVARDILRDISRETSRSPSLNWQASWNENLRTTFSVNFTQSEELKGKEVNFEEILSPSLNLDYRITRPLSIKFPFVKRKLLLSHQIETGFNLGGEFRQRIETNLYKIRLSRYTMGVNFKYQVQQNLSATLGVKGEYFDDQLAEGKDYYAYEGSLGLEFRF
ncbi:TPA: hypothetical protein DCX15_02560, partial [bacterium]|nr:hypothetical protein [bacterium]